MKKVEKERILLSPPHMSGREMNYIHEAFESNWIAPLGPNVDNFEKELCVATNSQHAVALNSGTAAIHLALVTLGVKPGDEIICSSFTFSASANPILYVGALPVFVDSEPETWNMCPGYLESAISERIAKGKKPKAIILVHLYGNPAKLEEIMKISDKYAIPIIEDAAESLGSTYHGKMTGTFGKIGIYSFNGNKIITTSGGGALVSDDKNLTDHVRFLASQARDKAPHYQHSQVGYNYRMSNVIAGIGRGQLEVLNERVEQRRNNFKFYQEALSEIPSIKFNLSELSKVQSNHWLTCIYLDENSSKFTVQEICNALEKENIESRPLWKPMHMQPVFQAYPFYGNGFSESLFQKGLCLPSGSNLTNEQKNRVVDSIKSFF
jgi:dTDP-4-amino-4,6-dideoxygalactose transaminase